jgi:transposase InsO family protein
MCYQLIDNHRAIGSVATLCAALGVSVSGYYAWRNRSISERQQADVRLLKAIRQIQHSGRGLYGSDRIHKRLCAMGMACSRKRVARLMGQHGLNSRRRHQHRHHTTDSRHDRPVAPNLLGRDFHADTVNEKWLGDIVGIWTGEAWLYLAAILDCFSRMIVGWAMSAQRDEQLVEDALIMALIRRNIQPDSKLLHHTDRGSQYTANDYLKHLADCGIQVSMSNKADPYDNAMMESFFATLRAELTDLQDFVTHDAARVAIFDFIEVFYNRLRIHSSIGYISPVEYEANTLS